MITVTYEVQGPEHARRRDAPEATSLQYLLSAARASCRRTSASRPRTCASQSDAPAPDFQILMGAAYYFDNGYRTYPNPAFTLGAVASCGRVERARCGCARRIRTTSRAIHLGFLGDPSEVKANVEAVRLRARDRRDRAARQGGRCGTSTRGRACKSDEQIEAWIRAEMQHEYHPSCTVRMGGEDDAARRGVRVRGVDGLRVVDCSSFPTILGGNTNAPTIMLAERRSDLILGRDAAAGV